MMTVIEDVYNALAAAGLPVRVAGASVGALPAVQITPSTESSSYGPGGLYVNHAYDVVAMVPAASSVSQLIVLEQLVDAVGHVLRDAAFFDVDAGRIRNRRSTDADEIPWTGKAFTVTAPGEPFCSPTTTTKAKEST